MGEGQGEVKSKSNMSAPSGSYESVIMTGVIGAMEEQGLDVVDIPGDCNYADMDEKVHMRLANLHMQLDPKRISSEFVQYIYDNTCIGDCLAQVFVLKCTEYRFCNFFSRDYIR
jgi:hypothetical protein